ncbi:MAG: hypothetical protein Ct9H90mP16_19600 [Candidatus Poseidoniales archaeon]|nr:MAG: hypothetical protein Ct9H90mP16_19600 [Candidatus Poseidoniales archaeon]
MKIGLAVSAAWYVAYLLGMALKWSPSEVNISTSATTGATHASTGFIFTFPAIFLLSSQFKTEYHVNGAPLLSGLMYSSWPSLALLQACSQVSWV